MERLRSGSRPSSGTARGTAARAAAAALTLVLAAACSSVDTSDQAAIDLRIAGSSASSSVAGSSAASLRPAVTVRAGGDTATLERVGVSFEEVQVAPEGVDCVFTGRVNDGDGCGTVNPAGNPVVDSVPVSGEVDSLQVVGAPPNDFSALQFRISVLNPGNFEDQRVLDDGNEEMEGASVRVEGQFNSDPFAVNIALDDRFRVPFPTIALADREVGRVTLRMDVSQWFRDGSGGLVDPRGGLASDDESTVESNIRASLSATSQAP